MTTKAMKDMTPEEREAFQREAESKIHTFKFEAPPPTERPKQVTHLVRTDILGIAQQVVKDGGENNLHYHTSMDEGWLVIRGRATFWGPDDVVLGELGPLEGIFIPAGARYRFAKEGPEQLEILQMIAFDRSAPEQANRVNVEVKKGWMVEDIFKTDDPSMAKT